MEKIQTSKNRSAEAKEIDGKLISLSEKKFHKVAAEDFKELFKGILKEEFQEN